MLRAYSNGREIPCACPSATDPMLLLVLVLRLRLGSGLGLMLRLSLIRSWTWVRVCNVCEKRFEFKESKRS